MEYFIGIDIGSQSTKGLVTNKNGKIIATHVIQHEMISPHMGHFEHDPINTWWNEFCKTTKVLISKSKIKPKDIKVLGHSAISSSLCVLDKDYLPLRMGILYGIDTRAEKEQRVLTELFGANELLKTGGCPLSSQSVAPKILWIKNHEKSIWKKTRKLVSANSYISYRLTGNFYENTYDAVGHTGLYNIFTKKWIKKNIEMLFPTHYLPELISPMKVAGYVHTQAAKECGLEPGTAILPGVADAAAECLASGASDFGDMMLMLGTSSFFILYTKNLFKTKKLWASSFLNENEFVLTGGTSNCGSAIEWFIEQFCDRKINSENVYQKLITESQDLNIDYDSPLIIPYFAGERTPLHDSNARAIFYRIGLHHTSADLFLALLEGIAYSIKLNIVELQKYSSIKKIYAIGGVVQNHLLLQLISDICGIEIHIPKEIAGAAYGDAFMAAKITHSTISIKNWVSIKKIFIPNLGTRTLYSKRFDLFKKLYQKTKFQ